MDLIQQVELFPENLREYLEKRILWGLEVWTRDENDKGLIAKEIVSFLIEEVSITMATNKFPISHTRKLLKDKVECISKILRVKVGENMNRINTRYLQMLYEEYIEHNQKNHQVYENISRHHLKIKDMDWKVAVEKDEDLEVYAEAAVIMGNKHWVKSGTEWMYDCMNHFYYKSQGKRFLDKMTRKYSRDLTTAAVAVETTTTTSMLSSSLSSSSSSSISSVNNIIHSHVLFPSGKNLKLLDVGSCFNPFKQYSNLDVMALDLCPADRSVQKCDFLNITITNTITEIDKETINLLETECVKNIQKSSFHVVVMSLVLSYLPDPMQRLKMIQNARAVLHDMETSNEPGMLLIFEKGSILHSRKYYNIFLNHWKKEISKVGFDLYRYEQLHIKGFTSSLSSRMEGHRAHVFAFVTSSRNTQHPSLSDKTEYKSGLWIKQDFQNDDDDNEITMNDRIINTLS